jgi:hypothetical protein
MCKSSPMVAAWWVSDIYFLLWTHISGPFQKIHLKTDQRSRSGRNVIHTSSRVNHMLYHDIPSGNHRSNPSLGHDIHETKGVAAVTPSAQAVDTLPSPPTEGTRNVKSASKHFTSTQAEGRSLIC